MRFHMAKAEWHVVHYSRSSYCTVAHVSERIEMGNMRKTKKQFLEELDRMQRRVAELESRGAGGGVWQEGERYFIHDVRLLSRAAMALVELGPEENIYELIGIHMQLLAGDAVIIINSFDNASLCLRVEAIIGIEEQFKTILKMLGRHPVGTVIPINEEAKTGLTSGKLEKVSGGLHALSMGKFPKAVCRGIERVLGMGDAYAMGFVWGGELFGSSVTLMRRGVALRSASILETFVRQASIALQRRHAEDALRKAHDGLELEVERRTSQLMETRDMLVQSEKLAAIGRLSAAVAHEILNPVNIISMRLQLLEKTEEFSEQTRNILGVCKEQLHRIIEIIDELGQFSRLHARGKSPCDLNDIVGRVMHLCAPQLKESDIRLELQYDANLQPILLEKGRVEQVLFNIVSNATEAMQGQETRQLRVRTESGASEGHMRVIISDTGTGILHQDLKQIFDPFFTTKEPGAGTGLGLFIAYNIVKEHDGRIWAENNKWGGVTFFIEFPPGEDGQGSE